MLHSHYGAPHGFSGETFSSFIETFLPPGSGHNNLRYTHGKDERGPLTLSSTVPAGPVAVDLLGTPPQDAVQWLLCLSLFFTVLPWNPLPASSLLLYLNLWKLISACFLGIYASAGRCEFYLWIRRSLDKEMATHTIIPPRKAHGQRNLVGDLMGFQRVRHDLVNQQ